LLKANGYRYRRPKYDLGHLQDKEAKARAEELLEELKMVSYFPDRIKWLFFK
jgi:hypothetical protein